MAGLRRRSHLPGRGRAYAYWKGVKSLMDGDRRKYKGKHCGQLILKYVLPKLPIRQVPFVPEQLFLTTFDMALLELLQPVLKSDADTSKFVDLFKSNVGGLPGIREHKAATVIKASGIDARKQGGTHFVVG